MNKSDLKIAIVGATGLVGQQLVTILSERGYDLKQLHLAASERSVGRSVNLEGQLFTIQSIEAVHQQQPDVALFSAGGDITKAWASAFQKAGIRVIDNSSAYRMDPDTPLIIPEVNAGQLTTDHMLIANPNCSTIQLAMALYPLHQAFGVERVNVSTYQSVTGSGQKALDQLRQERGGYSPDDTAYPWPIDLNCLPHCDDFEEDGYTREEHKVINESRKILKAAALPVTATAVRVPVTGGHAESVNVTLSKAARLDAIHEELEAMPGVIVQDAPAYYQYPMPRYAQHHDEVFVGRIRQDPTQPNSWHLWVVSDNLRKGAATNAVQILDHLAEQVLT